jgi:lipopolysaccharide export system ATP-binding protein
MARSPRRDKTESPARHDWACTQGSPVDLRQPATAIVMSELKASNLRKRYRSRVVVQDVSLSVSSGQVVGLLGPNGAGKTTCFYMIVGLVAVDGGRIDLDGTEIHHLPMHARARMGLSYLPQEASVFRKLSVEENILAVLELINLSEEERRQRLNDLLADLNISHLRNNPALSLSGGERRRVEIARALATQPAFILLDEPFAGVDPIAVIDIQKIIRYLKERGIGVLITDHNVRETLGICDRAYIINEGSVLAAGEPDEIVYNETVRRVYLGENFRL